MGALFLLRKAGRMGLRPASLPAAASKRAVAGTRSSTEHAHAQRVL